MNRSESARLPLLDALLSVGPEGTTREDLIQRSGTSSSSFYRIITPLIKEGLVEAAGPHYRLVLAKSYNYRYKLWRDAERVLQLEPGVRQQVEDVVQEAQEELDGNLKALWLVGSAAHGTFTPQSDLDFLAVVQRENQFLPRRVRREVQFVSMTTSSFQRKVKEGDSFVLSALRFGMLLEDRGYAQAWLDTPQQIELEARQVRSVQDSLDELRSRLLSFLRIQERQESQRLLKAYAITLGRALLAFFHELPAGKADLIQGLELYYGKNPVSDVIQRVQACQVTDELAELQDLEEYWLAFLARRGHLEVGVHYPYNNGVQFNYESNILFTQALGLSQKDRVDLSDAQIDDCYEVEGRRVCFEPESTFGKIREETIERFGGKLRESHFKPGPDTLGVVIANPQNKVRLSNRQFEVSPQVQALAHEYGLCLLSSGELLRLHNQIQLTQQGRKQLLKCLGF